MTGLFTSPRSNSPESACIGKHRFESREMAAKVSGRKERLETKVLHPYHCPFCKGWHVGHDRRASSQKPPNRRKTGRGPRRHGSEGES